MNEDLDHLVPAIVARDVDSFAEWLSHAESPLRRSLASFATVVDVEAIVQESLIRVWTVAPRFEPDGAPNGLFRLAIRIARNLAISETRRSKKTVAVDERLLEEPDAEPWTPPDPLLRKVIRECHSTLSGKPREALDARLSSRGNEPDEILAERLEMRLNTFLQNFTRARRFLAECLKRHGVAVDEELFT